MVNFFPRRTLLDKLLGWTFSALALCAALALIYFWNYGMLHILHHWKIPYFLGMLLVLGSVILIRQSSLIFTIIGIVGSILVLKWPWYFSLVVYLPTLSLLFAKAAFSTAMGIITAGLEFMAKLKRGRQND